jgi:hypothetical protein
MTMLLSFRQLDPLPGGSPVLYRINPLFYETEELVQIKRLRQVGVDPYLCQIERLDQVGMAAQKYDSAGSRQVRTHPLHQFFAVEVGHDVIQYEDVEAASLLDKPARGNGIVERYHSMSPIGKDYLETPQECRVVIDKDYIHDAFLGRSGAVRHYAKQLKCQKNETWANLLSFNEIETANIRDLGAPAQILDDSAPQLVVNRPVTLTPVSDFAVCSP